MLEHRPMRAPHAVLRVGTLRAVHGQHQLCRIQRALLQHHHAHLRQLHEQRTVRPEHALLLGKREVRRMFEHEQLRPQPDVRHEHESLRAELHLQPRLSGCNRTAVLRHVSWLLCGLPLEQQLLAVQAVLLAPEHLRSVSEQRQLCGEFRAALLPVERQSLCRVPDQRGLPERRAVRPRSHLRRLSVPRWKRKVSQARERQGSDAPGLRPFVRALAVPDGASRHAAPRHRSRCAAAAKKAFPPV